MSTTTKTLRIGLMGVGARLRSLIQLKFFLHSEEGKDQGYEGGVVAGVEEGAQMQVVAAYDPDPLAHQALRELLGHEYIEADSEEALAKLDLDWIFIGSWNVHHARQAILALENGKHVFCEKPLATNIEDCLGIRDAVERSGRTFFFGLVLRYSGHYQAINRLLQDHTIGKLVSFEFNETLAFNHGGYIFGNWRKDPAKAGSHVLEKCCHDLDLANWMAGALPLRVASFGGLNFFLPENRSLAERIGPNEEGRAAYAEWDDPHRVDPFDGKAGILDNQVVILEYANGVRATFHMNCNTAIPERRFYLCGTEGTLRAELYSSTAEVKKIGWETQSEMISGENGALRDLHGGGDAVMMRSLLRTMTDGTPSLASIAEGIEAALTAFAIDQAIAEGGVVDLAPMWARAGIDPQRPTFAHAEERGEGSEEPLHLEKCAAL